MKYQVATIVSVVLCALLISAAYLQTSHREQGRAAIAASLSKMEIRQLTRVYWECQDPRADDFYKFDPATCAVIGRTMLRRVGEVPALQIVKIESHLMIPDVQFPDIEYSPAAG